MAQHTPKGIDYAGFIPDSETDPELIQPYTDALASEQIDYLLESMAETVHMTAVDFDGKTDFGIGDHLLDLEQLPDDTPEYESIDFHTEATFSEDSVTMNFARLVNDRRSAIGITKRTGVSEYYAFNQDGSHLRELNEDDMVAVSVRAAGIDPAQVSPEALRNNEQYDGTSVARPTFPQTLAVFWSELAMAHGGSTTKVEHLQLPLPGSDESRPTYARLMQEEIEKMQERTLRLTLAHVTSFPDLDAEQVTRLVLEYTWQTDKNQTTELGRYVISDVKDATPRIKLRRTIPEGKVQKLDPKDPKYLKQFQDLLTYMLNVATVK